MTNTPESPPPCVTPTRPIPPPPPPKQLVGPYWMLRDWAQSLAAQPCARYDEPDHCRDSGDCITEYCAPCCARVVCEQRRWGYDYDNGEGETLLTPLLESA